MSRTLLALLCLSISACSQFPELDHTQSPATEAAAYPDLIPIEPILAGIEQPGNDVQEAEDATNPRLSRLRARAANMRGAVLSDSEKRRLETEVR